MRSPFKFLDSYTDSPEDQLIFFGREKEAAALVKLTYESPLVLLYGMSGTGKTSLVQCGLAKEFDGPDWLPLLIRRDDDINDSLRHALLNIWPDQYPVREGLTEQISFLYRYYMRPIYLIFDQFEEIFTLGDKDNSQTNLKDEAEKITESINSILNTEIPCKIILVIREEFIGRLYEMEQAIPRLYDFRLRIEPVGRNRVKDIIQRNFDHFNIHLIAPETNLDLICDQLSGKRTGIQLPFLQIYLDQLYTQCFSEQYDVEIYNSSELPKITVSENDIDDLGDIDIVLQRFLNDQNQQMMSLLDERSEKDAAQKVKAVLEAFVTREGTKQPVTYFLDQEKIYICDEYSAFFPSLKDEELHMLLQHMIDNRILKQGDQRLELAHDSLADRIHKDRDANQQQILDLLSRITLAEKDFSKTEEYLSKGLLARIDDLQEEITPRLNKDQCEFIAKSKQYHLELAEAEARNKRKLRNSKVFRILTALLFIMVCVALYFISNYFRTNSKLEEANNTLKISFEDLEEERAIVEDQNIELEIQKSELETKKSELEANENRLIKLVDSLNQANNENQRLTNQLQNSIKETLGLLFDDTEELMRELRFEEAYEKIRKAIPTGLRVEETSNYITELAFVDNEVGLLNKAIEKLELVSQLTQNNIQISPDRGVIRQVIADLNPEMYAFWIKKYYPNLVTVPPGNYTVGCRVGDLDCEVQEKNNYTRRIESFQIATTEITNWQYYLFRSSRKNTLDKDDRPEILKKNDRKKLELQPAKWGLLGDFPVVNISWFDAVDYCKWLNTQALWELDPELGVLKKANILKDQLTEENYSGFRLPTEAEWEYAASDGKSSDYPIFSGANGVRDLGQYAWYGENSKRGFNDYQAHPVATLESNSLGVYDMSGNVFEWCWDWYSDKHNSVGATYYGPPGGSNKVIKGGSYNQNNRAKHCRISYRNRENPQSDNRQTIGFRVVLVGTIN